MYISIVFLFPTPNLQPKFDHNLRNKEGSTPLMAASFLGRIPMIKFMLQSAIYNTLDEMDEE